ncbi:MAG: ATP synthase F1 subunit epsilon [Candidatus Moranbacteria bacterium]|nr:ATP synthase F1 subunit epsilon [Candidatus Moranbacteria bacterium]MDD3964490.1 ATP synthase F1 subunit epsilon [Candidatus Moranbacteria bacterium]
MIKFKIITPERIVVEEEIYQATLPIEGGEVTILPEHIPYIGTIRAGEIMFRKTLGGEESSLAVSSGFVEFHNDEMVILADTAEHAEEIDLTRAEEARKRAEELKKEHLEMGGEEYARTTALIEKEMARVRVAHRHHSRRGISLPSSE